MTEKQKETGRYYYRCWLGSNLAEITDAYRSPSSEKRRSYNEIRQEMRSLGGDDLKVLTHTCHFYTCGYRLGDKLVVHTKSKRMEFNIDEIMGRVKK